MLVTLEVNIRHLTVLYSSRVHTTQLKAKFKDILTPSETCSELESFIFSAFKGPVLSVLRVCKLLTSLVTMGVVTKAFKNKMAAFTAKMLRGFPSPFSFMSHVETAKATENYAITFRKSEAVINFFRP